MPPIWTKFGEAENMEKGTKVEDSAVEADNDDVDPPKSPPPHATFLDKLIKVDKVDEKREQPKKPSYEIPNPPSSFVWTHLPYDGVTTVIQHKDAPSIALRAIMSRLEERTGDWDGRLSGSCDQVKVSDGEFYQVTLFISRNRNGPSWVRFGDEPVIILGNKDL
ncbi:uncharacterized protein PG998_000041 [Apiospora kogelbergensis]|uniref:uncharacterized protein n=1 Tax=Apiospora kogelbergensis TaxID=1337665 RepID=UPI00312CCBF2